MTVEFKTLPASALQVCPATQGRCGVAATFEINGHRVTLVAPDSAALKTLCQQWGVEVPVADDVEPVIVVSRFVLNVHESDGLDGLDDESDDGLGDGL